MQTGEDIVAAMQEEEDSDMIHLIDPMRLVFRRMPTGQTVMMMMPWLPVELIKENSAHVYSTDIITIVEPKEAMIRYYDKVVERVIEDMLSGDDKLDQLLADQDDEEPSDEEIYEEILQHVKEVKNKKLH
jgi:ubiquinone/menaquinone biosynthesis C-methylase UbiE